jgi:hypothetical protein
MNNNINNSNDNDDKDDDKNNNYKDYSIYNNSNLYDNLNIYDDKNNNYKDYSIYNNSNLYDNLNIYDEQNNIKINFVYYTSYLCYKKKIFLNINEDFKSILNLFNNDLCEILINIYILKKKNKISDKHFNNLNFIFNYIEKLDTISFIDQENFFTIIIDFYIINVICDWINIFFENYMFKELIDYKMLIENISRIYLTLNKKILLFRIFDEIFDVINDNDLVKQKILYLAQKISFDLFMFYDSKKIYDLITNIFIYLNDLLSDKINKDLSKIINKNNTLLSVFEKNKNVFINEYNKNKKLFTDIYTNDIELYVKFKINKNPTITNFIKNIKYIQQI